MQRKRTSTDTSGCYACGGIQARLVHEDNHNRLHWGPYRSRVLGPLCGWDRGRRSRSVRSQSRRLPGRALGWAWLAGRMRAAVRKCQRHVPRWRRSVRRKLTRGGSSLDSCEGHRRVGQPRASLSAWSGRRQCSRREDLARSIFGLPRPGPTAQRRATGRTVKSQYAVQFVTTPTCTRFDRPPSAQRIVYTFADGSHVNHRLNFCSISQLATYALVGGAVLGYSPASAQPAEIAERMLRAMPMDARFDSVLKRTTATVLAARANLHPNVKLAFACAMAKVAGRFDRAYFVARTAAHFRDRQSEAEQLAVFLESPMAQKHLVPLELSLESRWPAWGSVAIESADRSEWAKATSGSIEAIGQEWLNRLRESVDSDMTRDVPNELQKCGQEMLDAAKV